MMTKGQARCALAIVAGLMLQGAAAARQEAPGFVRVNPENIKWVDIPGGLGAQNAVIEGDPSKPGIYVVRQRFPRGVMSRPHTHSQDRHAIVISGTWWTGTGGDFRPDATLPVRPGGYMKHPAGGAHFDGAKDEDVVLQIMGMGPVNSPRIRPQDGDYGYSLKP
jgi:hypothetical protein